MTLEIRSILPRFGAEIRGIDIARPLDAESVQQIVAAQARLGVTVWRDTGLDDDTHVAFSRIFGHVELAPRRGRFSRPELFDASNLDANGQILDDELRRLTNAGNRLWHTDSSYMDVRSAQSLLLCHEAPPEGGPTWFADTRSAYDDLPASTRADIEGLVAEHSYFWSRRQAGYPYTEAEIDAKPSARHPLVHTHAASGRKALFLGAHARGIVGMDPAAGQALIRELIDWCTRPEYVFSVDYRPGDLVIWDNLCSMHRGGDFDERAHRRDMRRTTIREPGRSSPTIDPFGDMFRTAEASAPATVH